MKLFLFAGCLTLENFLFVMLLQFCIVCSCVYSVIMVYLPGLYLNQLYNPKLDVPDYILSSSSKQCQWRSQPDIWSCKGKFRNQFQKDSISKEINNDLNLHSMTKLLDWLCY